MRGPVKAYRTYQMANAKVSGKPGWVRRVIPAGRPVLSDEQGARLGHVHQSIHSSGQFAISVLEFNAIFSASRRLAIFWTSH